MGNVNFTYRASRGNAKPGEPINNARDAFEMLIENELSNLADMFAAASEEDKETIDRLFDGEAEGILGNESQASMWAQENSDEVLEEFLLTVRPMLQK